MDVDKELVAFLQGQGHSEERAVQIAGNHPDAVRAEMEKGSEEPQEPESAPDLTSISKYLDRAFTEMQARIEALEGRHDRLIDHVNREIGIAGDTPLIERIRSLEAVTQHSATKIEATPASQEQASNSAT